MSARPAGGRPPSLTAPRRLHFHDASHLAEPEVLLRRAGRKHMHDPGDDPGPSGLVACSEAGPVVTMEVLVEEEVVAPVCVLLKLARSPVDRPPAILVPQKHAGHQAPALLGDLAPPHLPPSPP